MRNGTRVRVTCGRCGQPRELVGHICVARSGRAARRAATPQLKLDFGKCGKCSKRIGNPLTHTCKPRSDFRKRKREAEKPAKQQRDKHDYLVCKDPDCPRPLCVAYKTGDKHGYQRGFNEGFEAGYAAGKTAGYREGFDAGLASCPGPHGGK